MKWSTRGACAALSSCLLLACALSAAAVGLKCFSLGSELKGEPFLLGSAAGAFYSGVLLAAGLSLLAAALFCRRQGPGGDEAAAEGAAAGAQAAGVGTEVASVQVSHHHGEALPLPQPPRRGVGGGISPGGRQNFLLLGVLVFMLGVLSAFAGAVIDGDTVSLVEKKYSRYCLLQAASPSAAAAAPPPGCQKLRDYQRGLVISTIFNALECLLGLLNLLLVKNYKAAQQRGLRRRRRRRRRQEHQLAVGRRRRHGGGSVGGRRPQRPSQGSIFSSEDPDLSPAGLGSDCPFQAVSYINVGVFHVFDEAGVEVQCGGHPSIELPGYSPMDPDLDASYPYCYPLPNERPPPYEEIYPPRLSSCANRV